MAGKPRAGRKPAKNEVAAGLINALKFCGVIKAPTTTSMAQHHHVFLNAGYAIAFDGIVAAGHPIDADIQGYPHAKLLVEALENTDKTFSWVRHTNGTFEIKSEKYNALVPALPFDMVIPTMPALNQGGFTNAEQFVKALETAGKIAVESGDVALHSALRLTGTSVFATDGGTVIEVLHGNQVPPILIPKQFVTSLIKTGKFPVGMGISADWDSFTVWFEDHSWLRTNTYGSDIWPESINETYSQLVSSMGDVFDVPPKLWAAVSSVLPFAEDDRRIIIRPGLVRTHADRNEGAAIEVAEIAFTIDVDGKRLSAIEPIAKQLAIGSYHAGSTLVFFGDNMRGVIAGMSPQADPAPAEPAQGGWGSSEVPTGGQPVAAGGWNGASAVQMAAPAPEEPQNDGWGERAGIPADGLAGDTEAMGIHDPGPVEYDDAYVTAGPDNGFNLGDTFNAQQWLDSLKDE